MVSSKYKTYQLVVVTIFSLLFVFISVMLMKKEFLSSKDIFFVSLLLFFACYLLFSFFYHSPKIILDRNSIIIKSPFKTIIYSWEDVAKVYLSSKEYYSVFVILRQTLPAMKLVFKNDKTLIFWEDMYGNMNQMRQVITDRLNNKIHFMKKMDERTINNLTGDKKYAGNPFTSLNTLLLTGLIIFFAAKLPVKEGKEIILLLPLSFISLLYLLFGTQMNYFEIKSDKLIIKNQYFPWKNVSYKLNEIEEVGIESPYRRSDGLRIITYQFKSKFYGAGSLREHTWNELLKDLESIGIKVGRE